MSVAPLDWAFLGLLLGSVLLGLWRGLVYEVVSALGWVAAFILAQWFGPQLAPRLPMAGAAEPLRLAASFALIFIATVFAGGMLAWLVKKLVSAIGLQPADRTMGAAFGLLRGLVLLLAIVFVVNMTPLKTDGWWQQSVGVPLLNAALRGMQPVLDALGVSSRWPAGYSPGKSP